MRPREVVTAEFRSFLEDISRRLDKVKDRVAVNNTLDKVLVGVSG